MNIIIGNGPSSIPYRNQLNAHLLIGCNLAFLDWPLEHLIVRDRIAVLHIDHQYCKQLPSNIWCSGRYLKSRQDLKLSDAWRALPGQVYANAGACAISLASELWPGGQVYCIGFDSVLDPQTPSNTAYDYPFRTTRMIRDDTQISHRRQVRQAVADANPLNVMFVSDTPFRRLWTSEDWDLSTISHRVFQEQLQDAT